MPLPPTFKSLLSLYSPSCSVLEQLPQRLHGPGTHFMCMRTYVCMYIYLYMYMYACVYVYVYAQI